MRETSGEPGIVESKRPAATNSSLSPTSSDVAALQQQLQQIPETRDAVVAQAREKVAQGGYFSRSSAEATALAIFSSE
jgi:hypothetical protein